jgi:hypothetical protein
MKVRPENCFSMFLVDDVETLDSLQMFHPEFTHQIFGEHESIYGYKNPMLKLYYGGPLMRTYISFEYKDVLRSADSSGKPCQEVVEILSKYMAKGEIMPLSFDRYLICR